MCKGEFQAIVNEFVSHETKEEEKKEENSEEFSQVKKMAGKIVMRCRKSKKKLQK